MLGRIGPIFQASNVSVIYRSLSTKSCATTTTTATKKYKKLDVSGIFPPIPTPFSAQDPGKVDYDQLRNNLKKWNQQPLSGIVVHGSNGEFVSLSEQERVEMIKVAREVVPADRLLIAGTGCEGTHQTIAMTEKAASLGVDAALVITPSFWKAQLTPNALEAHYRAVADASPIPVILYCVAKNTAIDMSAELVIKLSSHPNIIAMKDSGGDVTKFAKITWETRDTGFQLLAGSAGFLYPSLCVGAVGGVLALANIAALQLSNLVQLHSNGKFNEAKQLQQRLIDPNTAVTARFGVSGLKASMEMQGFYGGPVRLPLLEISKEDKEVLRKILQNAALLPSA